MRCLLGMGGNTGDVAAALAAAVAALRERFGPLASSGVWRTKAIGPQQPLFLNAAALLDADVHPLRLLAFCLKLEAEAGRDRRHETGWGPRPLDLDILLVEGLVSESPALIVPHPRLHERRFALLPACELAGGWAHPRLHRTLAELLADLDPAAQPCELLGDMQPGG